MPGKSGNRYTPQEWAEIRAVYEAGIYKSLQQLHDSYRKKNRRVPSIDRLMQRCAKENWDKASREEELREAVHDKFKRIAAEVGLDDKEIVSKIKEMVDDKGDRNNGLQRLFDITGIRAPHKVARTDTAGDDAPDRVLILPANGFEAQR